jgi:peptidoglycan/xylan/chitin deacetylase (PgdA/CDA1 family)
MAERIAGRVDWPNGARCAAVLTFDFDAESIWLSRDPSLADRLGLMSQARYGPQVGVPRILELLQSLRVRATFFVPGWVAEQHPDPTRAIRDSGHEIGHHGYLHERPMPNNPEGERTAFLRGLEALAQVTGVRPVGYRAPGWEMTPLTLSLLREAGLLYSSALMDDAWPYVHRHPDGDIVELPVKWLLDDGAFFTFYPQLTTTNIFTTDLVLAQWKEELLGVLEFGGLFNLTMHPQLTGHPSRLRMLRQLVEFAQSLDGVWLTTCEEVARYWHEHAGVRPR